MAVKKSTPVKSTRTSAKSPVARVTEAQIVAAIDKIEKVGAPIAQLKATLDEIQASVSIAKDDMTLGLAQHEATIEAKKSELNLEYEAKKSELETRIALEESKLNDDIASKKVSKELELKLLDEKISEKKTKVARELDELEWKASKDKRELNLGTASLIASEYEMEICAKGTVASTEEAIKKANEEIDARIESAVNEATSKVYRSKGSEISDLNSKLKMVEKELEFVKLALAKTEKSLDAKDAQLALVPGQIADAVEKAKSSIAVNNDNGGRK